MLFKPEMCQAILDGAKTQTRRLVKPYETGRILERVGRRIIGVWISEYGIPPPEIFGSTQILEQMYRRKWIVGRTYAIQPGRGKEAAGRFLLTGIRGERLQDISDEDAMAEGTYEWYKATQMSDNAWTYWLPVGCSGAAVQFRGLWNSIHCKKGTRWSDNAKVWVLELGLANTLKGV